MATGSDNNVWFTEQGAARIGKITTTGLVTEYAIPSGAFGFDIAAGTAGTLWFGECSYYGCSFRYIDKVTTAGEITEYPLPSLSCARGISKGPDGNMWFADLCDSSIGKITPTGTITEYHLPQGYGYVMDIASGPDGNLWFVEWGSANAQIGRITTSGTITEYPGPTDDSPHVIAAGPDGNLYAGSGNGIWRITTAGVITEFQGSLNAQDMILGPDKQMWLSGENQGGLQQFKIQEFDPKTQTFSQVLEPDPNWRIFGLTVGGDGDVWIAGYGRNTIDVYEEKIHTIGIRLNGEMSITDPNYGFEQGYAIGTTSTITQTIMLSMGESVRFENVDTEPHSAALLGNATANNAPWPGSFDGSTAKSPAGTAIGTAGWATGSLSPNKRSPIYETGLPGFYMIGCQYHYNTNEMRTVIVVH